MGLAPMRAGDSAGVAVRLPSIRVDSRRFFVEKCKLVRMNHVISYDGFCVLQARRCMQMGSFAYFLVTFH